MRKSSIVFTFFILALSLFASFGDLTATTFVPITLEKQLVEAEAVIQGEFNGISYKKTALGEVVTEASFSKVRSSGLGPDEIPNPNDFRITYPGGVWQGIVYHVYNAPSFKEKQEYVLLIKKGRYGYVLSNFSLGKYDIKIDNGEKILSSSVFPSHPSLGKISYGRFNYLLQKTYGTELGNFSKDNVVYRKMDTEDETEIEGENARSPASEKIEEDKPATNGLNIFWPVIILGLLGGISFWIRQSGQSKAKKG